MRKVSLGVVLVIVLLSGVGVKPLYAQSGTTYIVQAGDTLFSIARRYGISVQQLAATNNLSWNMWVYTGQRLQIPGGGNFDNAFENSGRYVVQAGDTLTSIALRLGVRVSDLATANGLFSYAWVYAGQVLTIPGRAVSTPPTASGTYVVKRGDTLFSIARRHNVSVAALRAANSLTTNLIYVGQSLSIPGAQKTPSPNPVQPTPIPGHGSQGEKWIDVNLTTQTVTAYEGQTPVLTSLASTGTRYTPTVVGTFKIYVKYTSTRMTGGSGASYYDLPNVPYTMYFYKGYALHGTYWHNNFGTPMSHGCVNLPTSNAEWLFNWAPVGTQVVTHY